MSEILLYIQLLIFLQYIFYNSYPGKCLSISDAIGRRLRDGDKIRYKVRVFIDCTVKMYCSYKCNIHSVYIHFSVEAEQEVFLKKKLKLPPTSSTIKNMCERVILFLFICQFRVCLSSFCYQQCNKFTKWSVGACSRSRYSPRRRAFSLLVRGKH